MRNSEGLELRWTGCTKQLTTMRLAIESPSTSKRTPRDCFQDTIRGLGFEVGDTNGMELDGKLVAVLLWVEISGGYY